MPMEKVSGWMLRVIRREKDVMALLAEMSASYETMLKAHPALKSVRICKNHAQIIACVEALELVTPITRAQKQATINALIDMAVARQQAINADHPLVTEFWEKFDHLNDTGGDEKLNHSRKDDIAVNLPELYEVASKHGTTLPAYADMKRLLPESRARKFTGYHTVNSALYEGTGKSVKCWVFSREGAASRNSD